ncbi:MAG: hypothetical protein HC830_12450 [Bacteroidetes bacterium]|nr:hypothetical protein [Bacteroidota bacterium]
MYTQSGNISGKGISIVPVEKDRKVDVYFDGVLFTSYIYPTTLEKPVLYPLKSAKGALITRGFPIEPRAGERVDHPHHVGWWLNYGDVNGLDFWNNSYAIPLNEKQKYGSILHDKVVKVENGTDKGVLVVKTQWVNNKKEMLLTEETTFIFSGDANTRRVIRISRLNAVQDVKFGDNKEGMCAIRVDRAFEQPSDKPEVFTDAMGKPTDVPVLNNAGVNGTYRSSEGKEKDAVWGTRAKWVSLSAEKDKDSVSICLFDHPSNYGFPAHWHARGYGLFSVNNIGSKAYNASDPETTMTLKKGESVTFKHMLLIKSGGFCFRWFINPGME